MEHRKIKNIDFIVVDQTSYMQKFTELCTNTHAHVHGEKEKPNNN